MQVVQAYQRWEESGAAAMAMQPAAAAPPPPPPPQMPEIESQCQFCLETRASVVLAPCLHKLCQRCLAMPREGQGRSANSRSCPFCRGPVTETRAIDAGRTVGSAETSEGSNGTRLKAFNFGDKPHEKPAPAKSSESQAKQRMALEHYQVPEGSVHSNNRTHTLACVCARARARARACVRACTTHIRALSA